MQNNNLECAKFTSEALGKAIDQGKQLLRECMQEFRCKQCGKLLAKVEGNVTTIPNEILDHITDSEEIDRDTVKLQIKCPRQHCKTINEIIV